MENSMLMPMARATVYLLEAFVLLVVAKWAYTGLYRRVCLREELFEKGNVALAVSTAGSRSPWVAFWPVHLPGGRQTCWVSVSMAA